MQSLNRLHYYKTTTIPSAQLLINCRQDSSSPKSKIKFQTKNYKPEKPVLKNCLLKNTRDSTRKINYISKAENMKIQSEISKQKNAHLVFTINY